LASADFAFVLEVEIHSGRSPISDDKGDRIIFITRPMRYPANPVPRRIPEREKTGQDAFRNGKRRDRDIDSDGEYFEGDKSS
jgi:hypothetical protein